MIQIQPLHDFILVERKDLAIKGKSLIFTPDAFKDKPNYGSVIAAGPGRTADLTGQFIPTTLKTGDDILFGKYAGIEIEWDGKKVVVMKEGEILGRVTVTKDESKLEMAG